MTIVEVIQAFVHAAPVGVVVTDTALDPPGPTIVYANPAFAELTGRPLEAVVGQSPRFMQGRETRRAALDAFRAALEAGERFHGYLTNYRGDSSRYRVEIDCRPLRGESGRIEHFVSFQREVVRRLGRPMTAAGGRYQPALVGTDRLSDSLRALGVFDA